MCVVVRHTVERAGTWQGPTAPESDLLSHTQLGILLLELYSSPHPPCSLEVAAKLPSRGPCKEQELMARMGSVVCYELHSAPGHSQVPGRRGGEAAAKCQVVVRLEWGWG